MTIIRLGPMKLTTSKIVSALFKGERRPTGTATRANIEGNRGSVHFVVVAFVINPRIDHCNQMGDKMEHFVPEIKHVL